MLPPYVQQANYRSGDYGDLPLLFQSSSSEVPWLVRYSGHVLSLSYHLLSYQVAADNGDPYNENKDDVAKMFKTDETYFFPLKKRRNDL